MVGKRPENKKKSVWGSWLEVLRESRKTCWAQSSHFSDSWKFFIWLERITCFVCLFRSSVWFLGDRSIHSLTQTFQTETKTAAETCALRQAAPALRSAEQGQTRYVNPKSMKTLVGLMIAPCVQGICVDSCRNVRPFTCQVYLPHRELCWSLLISPLQSTLRFSDER